MASGITLIIPLYNSAPYLGKVFESVLKQDYPLFEVVFVNDGSTDATGFLVEEFCKKDPYKYRLFAHEKNRGLNPARLTGLQQARYDLIVSADGDDYFDSDYLSSMANNLGDADIVCAPIITESPEGKLLSILNEPTSEREAWDTDTALVKLLRNIEIGNFFGNKLYRRSLLDGVDFSYRYPFEDYTISHIIFSRAKEIVKISKPSYHYVRRSGSLSSPNPNSYRSCIDAMLIRKQWFEERFPECRVYLNPIYDSMFDRFIQLLALDYVPTKDPLYALFKGFYRNEKKKRRMNRYIRRNMSFYLLSPRLYWIVRKYLNQRREVN